MHTLVSACSCVRVHMHVEAHVGMHVFLDCSPHARLRQGLSLSLEPTILNNVARQLVAGISHLCFLHIGIAGGLSGTCCFYVALGV